MANKIKNSRDQFAINNQLQQGDRIQLTLNISKKRLMLQEQRTPDKVQSSKQMRKSTQKIKWKKDKTIAPPIFICKTYQILQNLEYKDVITWNEEGNSFTIIDVQKFQQEILPVHFRHRNFSSFVRQLNMYDFHKIRNDSNKNIFEHKEFKKDHKYLFHLICRQFLKDIKRKGCNGKRNQQSQQNISISNNEEIAFDVEETPRNEDKYHQTIQSIERNQHESPVPSIRFIHQTITPTPDKKMKMEEFMRSLPDVIKTEEEIHDKINELIHDPNYECINTKTDIKKIISKIRRKIPRKQRGEDYEQLSIEEQIIAEKIILNEVLSERELPNPTMAILSTEKFLPKSINIIGSMNFCEDAEQLFYQKMY